MYQIWKRSVTSFVTSFNVVLCSALWGVYLVSCLHLSIDSVVSCEARQFERRKFQILNKTLLTLSLYLLFFFFLIVFNFKVPKVIYEANLNRFNYVVYTFATP